MATSRLEEILKSLGDQNRLSIFKQGLHGLEKESLRVNSDGTLALSPHPKALGSSLTNPEITTDFSESQIELITAPHESAKDALKHLEDLHVFVNENLGKERLWPFSMPCILPENDDFIPIARFGASQEGQKRELYREGLASRYGKQMQMLCGVHYNFSFGIDLWEELFKLLGKEESLQDFMNENYMNLVRNFIRKRWLLIYLFGATPLSHETYRCDLVKDKKEALALRMSRCGYANSAKVPMNYNSFSEHVSAYEKAMTTKAPEYEKLEKQLNGNILQLANEYYFPIRLKPGTDTDMFEGLKNRGVRYVEVRLFDLNPLEASGVSKLQMEFTHLFLLFCLLEESPPIDEIQMRSHSEDQDLIAMHGRAGLANLGENGLRLKKEADEIFTKINLLNEVLKYDIKEAFHKFTGKEKLLASQILDAKGEESFIDFGMRLSNEHYNNLLKNNPPKNA